MRKEGEWMSQAPHGSADFFFDLSSDACAVLERGRFVRANIAWRSILDCSHESLLGMHWRELVSPDDADTVARAMAEAEGDVGRFADLEARVERTDGEHRWLIWSGYTDSGRWLLSARDVTERREAQREIEAARDYLRAVTESMDQGLYTLDEEGRVAYMNRVAEELLGWRREELIGKSPHDAVHYRHPDGTAYPAEECPLQNAVRRAETLHVDDDTFIHKNGSEVPVAYSAAPFTTEAGTRGLVVVVSDITERKAKELELEEQLEAMSWIGRIRDALVEDRFRVYAQPMVSLRSGEVLHHELLIRMLDADGAAVPPGRFLPAAEEYSAIREIDEWMVERAAEIVREHPVSVNLSVQSVVAPGMFEQMRAQLERTGADPSHLCVEVTETAFLTDAEAAAEFVRRLEELGCCVALDDFGTGYGGFSYLKKLPVNYLKIDQEFVRDLTTNEASRHVVRAIVSLAQGFDQETIAEGAEDEATVEALRMLGVDYVQGFHIGRPAPASEAFSGSSPLPA